MHHAHNEKRKRIELPNQDKDKALKEKETYKYMGISEVDTIKQAEMKEKTEKEYPRRTRKRLETKLHHISHQMDKYLSGSPCKILGTILKVDEK